MLALLASGLIAVVSFGVQGHPHSFWWGPRAGMAEAIVSGPLRPKHISVFNPSINYDGKFAFANALGCLGQQTKSVEAPRLVWVLREEAIPRFRCAGWEASIIRRDAHIRLRRRDARAIQNEDHAGPVANLVGWSGPMVFQGHYNPRHHFVVLFDSTIAPIMEKGPLWEHIRAQFSARGTALQAQREIQKERSNPAENKRGERVLRGILGRVSGFPLSAKIGLTFFLAIVAALIDATWDLGDRYARWRLTGIVACGAAVACVWWLGGSQ